MRLRTLHKRAVRNRGLIRHIVMMSGGKGSYLSAKRVTQKHNRKGIVLLFADTKMEEPSLYRFIEQAARKLRVRLVKIADGRDVWQVFFDVRFMGNNRIDPCSKVLKRDLLRKWVERHADPKRTTIHIGIDWTEAHRFTAFAERMKPYRCSAPMLEPPYMTPAAMVKECERDGLDMGELYQLGFAHRNCGGFCVKAGQTQFRLLLKTKPELYDYHENKEQEFIQLVGKEVSILRDRSNNETKPLTLKTFRERVEAGTQTPLFDWGGCGCAID